ncbi:hypothetical protein OFC05_30475, partial [Escherichia coli]|nr:hypothetical protein [Escherichia coli]
WAFIGFWGAEASIQKQMHGYRDVIGGVNEAYVYVTYFGYNHNSELAKSTWWSGLPGAQGLFFFFFLSGGPWSSAHNLVWFLHFV